MERLEGAFVDISNVAVANSEPVDFQGISRLQRILPAFIFDRSRILRLLNELIEVNPDFRIVDLKVADEMPENQRFPMDARVQIGNISHRRIRMRSLIQPQLPQIDG